MEKVIDARGLRLRVVPEVYTPREDSFMMIDQLQSEDLNPSFICEIGPGSGIIGLSLIHRTSTLIAVDINATAARQSKENAKHNGYHHYHAIASDRIRPFRKNALPQTIIFNPPYLPEDPDIDPYSPIHEQQQLVGGLRGDETISELIEELPLGRHTVYTIISSLATNPVTFSNDHPTWTCRVLRAENMGFETIWLLRLR